MTNDIIDRQPNDLRASRSNKPDALDSLFASAQASEPVFQDTNFSKVVMNGLPSKTSRRRSRSLLFDCVGLVIGLISAYWFFDLSEIAQSALSLVPESLPITVANIASVFIGAVVLACTGWWTAEKGLN